MYAVITISIKLTVLSKVSFAINIKIWPLEALNKLDKSNNITTSQIIDVFYLTFNLECFAEKNVQQLCVEWPRLLI
jgi:hypothetical protein